MNTSSSASSVIVTMHSIIRFKQRIYKGAREAPVYRNMVRSMFNDDTRVDLIAIRTVFQAGAQFE